MGCFEDRGFSNWFFLEASSIQEAQKLAEKSENRCELWDVYVVLVDVCCDTGDEEVPK